MLFTVQGRGFTVLLKKEEYDYESSRKRDASALCVEKVGNASSVHRIVWLGVGLQGSAGQRGGEKCGSYCQDLRGRLGTLKHMLIS